MSFGLPRFRIIWPMCSLSSLKVHFNHQLPQHARDIRVSRRHYFHEPMNERLLQWGWCRPRLKVTKVRCEKNYRLEEMKWTDPMRSSLATAVP